MNSVYLQMLVVFGAGIFFFVSVYRHADQIWDFLIKQSVGKRDRLMERLKTMFIIIPGNSEQERAEKLLKWLLLCAFAPATLGFALAMPNLLVGLVAFVILFVVGWYIPEIGVEVYYRRRLKKFNNQLVDALTLMASGIKSSLALPQAMALVKDQLPAPASQEFGQVLAEASMGGMTYEEALLNMAKRVPSEEVEMFVSAVNNLLSSGGNLADIFSVIGNVIRERVKMEQKIQGMIAQPKFQGMFVLAIYPGMLVYQSFAEPENFQKLLSHPIGMAMLAAATALWLGVIALVIRVTRISI